ncbi:tetratricopeptide repeat protein [Gimesia panareensis]|uniref:Tetratricopeptide repeat protein n=1 Tax=Gimesia panareensis TaxID=2527978 RepID=A0A518FRQ6_9PLAN|nr:FG-GAP-like repeat-containing protein [Gimesia panareensis]QDV19022.1 tetratricopeptide repeat protein [Gimesia panareensis]
MLRLIAVLLILATIGLALWFLGVFDLDPAAQLQRGAHAFREQNYAEAKRELLPVLESPAHADDAALLLAEIAIKEGDFQAAIGYYDRVPDDRSRDSYQARTRSGEYYLFQLKQLSLALDQFERAYQFFPDDSLVLERLSFIYGLSTQTWKAVPIRIKLLREQKINPLVLYLLAMSDRSLENPQLFSEYEQASPEDPLVQLMVARLEVDEQEYQAAREHLVKLVKAQPGLSQAQVLLGQTLLKLQQSEAFEQWQAALPKSVREHPEIWNVEGQWNQQQGDTQAAIACFIQTLRRDATNPTACYQLGQLLKQTGETEAAERLLDYSRKLQTYEGLVKVVYGDKELPAAEKMVSLAQELGLVWEAYGWSRAALLLDPFLEWARQTRDELKGELAELPLIRTDPKQNPVRDLALPEIPATPGAEMASRATANRTVTESSQIAFADVTADAGIEFQYFNGHPWPQTQHKMYEFTGGGVGVLDLNHDGWPDLYLTQGTRWPVDALSEEYLDRLYLNRGDGTFQDVTAQAGIRENRFSQGVTIGDLNQDGFDDIYIGNIGQNRPYLNNGDGTYSEVEQAQGAADAWTTSCLMADLNGDAAPEIYAVNYLTGKNVFDRVCQNGDGTDRSCMPLNFPAAQDQLYLNSKDGTLENITTTAGIEVPAGKGLGIVAADFTGSGYPSLFVANDAVANFFFVNQGTEKLHFAEQALLSGLALNAQGRTEACMGIAAGDADGDGLLDLFVTNYYRETNTLYRQIGPGEFVDETQTANLAESSLFLLGFGTQFLDADLDGLQDLVIVNGHVEDLRKSETPWQMRPQFMQNRGKGKFEEVKSPELGSFFQKTRLGRGMARLDWNRDGREEVAVSSLDQPVVLLENRTGDAGNRLVIRLTGTKSNRDAIGTTVRLKQNGQTLVRQLTAGDGYQASNQRMLVFGLGSQQQVTELEVNWPSGLKQRFSNLAANQEVHLIEGQPEFYRLRSFE